MEGEVTRTYRIYLENSDQEVERELPADYAEAREMALQIAERNPKWFCSTWCSRDGDAFALDHNGRLHEMTID